MFEKDRNQRFAQAQLLLVWFFSNYLPALLRSPAKRPIALAPSPLAVSISVLIFGTASGQQPSGIELPEGSTKKSEFARLFEQHHETHQSDPPIVEPPSIALHNTDPMDSSVSESETLASTWDFYQGLERLASGSADYSLYDDAIHVRPIVVAEHSHDFNEPRAIESPQSLGESKSGESKPKGKLKPTANMTVQLQADTAFFDQDANNIATVGEIPDGAFFRRSRIGIFGELYETVEYRLEYDFANPARPQFLDNWIALTNIPVVNNVVVGHYFEPFSLERYSPNRFITFMERSLADTFAPQRNMGMMVYGNLFEKRLTYALGAFRSGSDVYGNDVSFNSGYVGTAHATYLAWYEEVGKDNLKLLHLGGSYSYRAMGDDPVNYSTRPSVRMR